MVAFKTLTIGAVMAAAALGSPASATFTLNNTGGGDGYVFGSDTSFDLFGSDNGSGDNFTSFTGVAVKTQSYIASFLYTSFDLAGSFYDPAGFYKNGQTQRLSPLSSDSVPTTSVGTLRFRVNAGDTYGFYVFSVNGTLGRADIKTTIATDVPEAPVWAMLITGFGLVGTVLRGRKVAAGA